MGFTKKVFERATIKGLTEYLLYGIGSEEDTRDYETRLDDAYHEYEQAVYQYDNNRNSKLLGFANKMAGDVGTVYAEIGIQMGILLMKDFYHNVYGEEDTADYKSRYELLSKDVTSALKLLENSEEDNVKKAREILKSAKSE